MGWGPLRNGVLLACAAEAGFEAMITVDRNLKHQQNLSTLPISVLVLRSASNDLDELGRLVPFALEAFLTLQSRQLVEIPG